jgi:chaperone LolA
MIMRRTLLALATLLVASAAHAEDKAATVQRVEKYLSTITTITADFSQVDANGQLAEGKFYLKRPGKMRWQYKPPTPILLVSDGKVIVYYDAELDQVNYVPMDDTLAGFLAKPVIKLESATTRLTKFTSKDGIIRASIVQKSKPNDGTLTLELTDKPMELRQMVITDNAGRQTRIQLQNAVFGAGLPDGLFKFEDPRGVAPRKNRRN